MFIGLWIGVSAMISIMGGWFWISRKFPLPNDDNAIIEKLSWNSMNLNYLSAYGSCVNIKIIRDGIILSTSFIIRPFHSPIFIPWESMEDFKYYKKWIFEKSVFYVRQSRFVIYGKAAKIIEKYAQNNK